MFLLDTNVVSELRKATSGKGSIEVANWARSVPMEQMFLSVISLQELEKGVLQKERVDPLAGAVLRAWLTEHVYKGFERRILPIDQAIAVCCAALHVPNPRPTMDALIAATAKVHGMTVVTRDEKDFAHFGVPMLNPWI
ncbi:type II toxin-antitoxin system VapC family toxin [Diaphorobacter sp. HDW4A]|uniref:type II toxin-antitoxin system VapC family toxin n=1 Tax=Diaphorobacter sp. HDW4A TaxID=2714924 RepID=UPI00140C5542|nr:type II toxin-antitoxin system VapC family toxin [Diaphorobacter sp. HDW4A]QIL82774.1 type II toxin-antitoxin system VapC family toxin [Diaphorobacter sp. HDW4A]